jgi:hypothetical protein
MSYATLSDLRAVLPENITIGDVTAVNVIQGKRDTISTSDANKFLYYANQYVDSRLHAYYLVPLKRIKKISQPITANMLPSSCVVQVPDAGMFFAGGCVKLHDTNGEEINKIAEVPEEFDGLCNLNNVILSVPTANAYDSGSCAYMDLLVYPDPVPIMTARFAVSYIYDKLFATDGSPDVSNYGKAMRNLAKEDLDSILTGQTRLEGQEYTGSRFVRYQVFNLHKSPADVNFGQAKE